MTATIRTVAVVAAVVLAAFAGVALGTPATTTTNTTDEQTNESATVAFPDQQFDGDAVTIDSATLPDGGFAVVYDQGGTPIGHTDYLTPGDHGNLTVSLNESVERPQVLIVTLFRNNGSQAYNASADSVAYQTDTGADVSDVAYVYFEKRSRSTTEETSTTTVEATASGDEETTDAGTANGTTGDETMGGETTGDETTEESSGGIPGFTPITAVVALLGAAFVALRRN